MLTENSLYTVESFKDFMQHLKPGGIFTVSHFYFRDLPVQVLRMTNITRIEQLARDEHFEIVIGPNQGGKSDFVDVVKGREPTELLAQYPVKLVAPRDDTPFFFHSLKMSAVFGGEMTKHGLLSVNIRAVRVLAFLLLVVVLLTIACIGVPLANPDNRRDFGKSAPYLAYFAALGLGFMLVEIALIQKLVIFLGHPTYALAVVLASLLLSSGLGSLSTQSVTNARLGRSGKIRLAMLLAVMVAIYILSVLVLPEFRGASNPVRILVATLAIFPLGIFMGMAFPLGMRAATESLPAYTAWFWGVNGATSVCGSVLGVAIAISYSIPATLVAGFACYVIALLSFSFATRAPSS